MSISGEVPEEGSDGEEVFIDEQDIIQEIHLDEEDLPDHDDDDDDDEEDHEMGMWQLIVLFLSTVELARTGYVQGMLAQLIIFAHGS